MFSYLPWKITDFLVLRRQQDRIYLFSEDRVVMEQKYGGGKGTKEGRWHHCSTILGTENLRPLLLLSNTDSSFQWKRYALSQRGDQKALFKSHNWKLSKQLCSPLSEISTKNKNTKTKSCNERGQKAKQPLHGNKKKLWCSPKLFTSQYNVWLAVLCIKVHEVKSSTQPRSVQWSKVINKSQNMTFKTLW